MSSSITLRGVQLLPLWRRRIPKYPVYWKGDPQLRIFLPRFWMRIVKPDNEVPKNHVHFEVHPQMTKYDIKNYIEKIYKVPVISVRTQVHTGEEIKHKNKGFLINREDNKKFAFLVMDDGHEFEFPDLFEDKPRPMDKEFKQASNMKRNNAMEERRQWDRAEIPPWFR